MDKKDVTILKRNEIVRGTDFYSINAKKCFNAIYYIYQRNLEMFIEYEERGVTHMSIKFSTLRELMCMENDNSYIQKIRDAVVELQTTLIELNNWTDPITKEKHKRYSAKFINYASVKNNKITTVELEISQLFKMLIKSNVNFTKISLTLNLNKLSTKRAMKLYEYIKSFRGYRYIDITHKHMCYLLCIYENSRYMYMGDMSTMLNRQLNEIAKKTDLEDMRLDDSNDLRKEKVFRIHINKSSKKTRKKLVDNIVKELAEMKTF